MPFRPSLTITTLLLLLHNTLSATTAQAILPLQDRQDNNSSSKKPPAWFLAGDSTTALQNEDGGGWGAGFLSFVRAPAWGTDYAVDGSTTVSFVDNGYWAAVLAAVGNSTGVYNPLVTIQVCNYPMCLRDNCSLFFFQKKKKKKKGFLFFPFRFGNVLGSRPEVWVGSWGERLLKISSKVPS